MAIMAVLACAPLGRPATNPARWRAAPGRLLACRVRRVRRARDVSTRRGVEPCRAVADAVAASGLAASAAVPALASLLTEHVCPDVASCAGLYLGEPERQMRVVELFWDLARAYDISHGGHGYVLRALLDADLWTAKQLCMGFDQYNAGLGLIRAALTDG
jgi:hypothetical protein